jgi:hypothetical protein
VFISDIIIFCAYIVSVCVCVCVRDIGGGEYVVDAAGDPVVAVLVAPRAVAGEVVALAGK